MSKYLNNHRNTSSTYLKLLESKWILKSFFVWRKKIFVFNEFLDLLDGSEW
jgi:hypothetical protein